jgi:hypothetical protein
MVKRKGLSFNLYSDDVYCSYGTDNGPLLNDEMAQTIENRANNHKLKNGLEITFNTYEESPIDKNEFLQAYSNTYNSKIVEKKHELSRCLITGTILMFVGIILLVVFAAVEEHLPLFWVELIDLFAWVFGWGGVEVLTIELIQIAIEIKKIKRLLKAHIHFTSDNIQSIVDTNKKIAQKVVKSQKENIELKKHI